MTSRLGDLAQSWAEPQEGEPAGRPGARSDGRNCLLSASRPQTIEEALPCAGSRSCVRVTVEHQGMPARPHHRAYSVMWSPASTCYLWFPLTRGAGWLGEQPRLLRITWC